MWRVEIVVSHRVDDHIEDDTLCKSNVDLTIVERQVVRYVTDDFMDDVDEHLSHARSSTQPSATPTPRRRDRRVGRKYIEVVEGDLQWFFVLDFNDQAMNSDPEEARANPLNILVGRDEDWHFLYDHYMSRAFQEQSWTNKAAGQKQPYNHSSGLKSFLQR
ncbi:CACTA en-spm transposon protein [Cucumis melo var. makuwa]|uniref:CACTA en-spm transposon protein n=1 Tax=Cucumis melo var. makuwa TaxID=1194695 RepID=A0A5D3DZ06_CUCMM|nr:CACTA en-spm transposon protein [Cucumis melo var. makuwa]